MKVTKAERQACISWRAPGSPCRLGQGSESVEGALHRGRAHSLRLHFVLKRMRHWETIESFTKMPELGPEKIKEEKGMEIRKGKREGNTGAAAWTRSEAIAWGQATGRHCPLRRPHQRVFPFQPERTSRAWELTTVFR